jgi:hypothetical protein
MVTRRQVAARLGKSIATVRRIEGELLHPIRNARGVYLFHVHEVEVLKRAVDAGKVQLWRSFEPQRDEAVPSTTAANVRYREAREDLLEAKEALSEVRRRHQQELDELKASHAVEVAEYDRALCAFERQLEDFMR